MIDNKKIIAWTPYGRRETVSILVKYVARDVEAGIVDEYHLFMNTDEDQVEDRTYAEELANRYSFIKLLPIPAGVHVFQPKQGNTMYYYQYAIEPDTVYVRLDDDLVYVHENAIENLVRAKIGTPALATFPIIINNAVSSYYLQVMGKIPYDWGRVEAPNCVDRVGWADAHFAEQIHRFTLDKIRTGQITDIFLHHDIQLSLGLQFSVSCFAAESDIYRELNPPGVVRHEEETWLTITRSQQTGRRNVIVGNSLVSHLSFYPHSKYIREETDILNQYRELAEAL